MDDLIPTKTYIKPFNELRLKDIGIVGGKNASLGEMYQMLRSGGIRVPDGFATTSNAYWDYLTNNDLKPLISEQLQKLDRKEYSNLKQIGETIRTAIQAGLIPGRLKKELVEGFRKLIGKYGSDISVAVRSSATAEDLPEASFAGLQETFLNIRTNSELLEACQNCFASLFTDRAIKYREDQGFDHLKIALSIGVQIMIRADVGCSGVIFTLDPDSGFDQVVHIAGVWGLGETIVQGTVNPDEFYVFKPALKQGKNAIVQRQLGSKSKTMQYAKGYASGMVNVDTPVDQQEQFVLTDAEITTLAKWSILIEQHYGRPMDIEWAKDGVRDELYILQARPETVYSQIKRGHEITNYKLTEKAPEICQGHGLGNKIAKGTARVLFSPKEAYKLQQGEILVTTITNPDWDPILRKAAAIVTDRGGRTSHAAIVAREMGAVAVIGTGNATTTIKDGQQITVSCAQGNTGVVYEGLLEWEEIVVDVGALKRPHTKPMLILGDPQQAFKLSSYPVAGVGLMRMEFVINTSIRIHPMALKFFNQIKDPETRLTIEKLCHQYKNKEDYFVQKLAEGVATIAAAFYPREVIVRMSDFKSNEYANLIGGKYFEPTENNPMLGFRGASRYYHEKYQAGFAMECEAIKTVRDSMGLTNVKVMIPFCRTFKEAEKVVDLMKSYGLNRHQRGLEIYMMTEIPSNVILAKEFARFFDGFSIGSNDLTQLTLGVDRDSELLSSLFDANDPAIKKMIRMLIKSARETGTKVGLCGQAPSDDPEFSQFLVDLGIDSISFNSDAVFKGIKYINQAEEKLERSPGVIGSN